MAIIQAFKEVQINEGELAKVQANLKQYLRQLNGAPFLLGVLLQEVSLSTAATNVAHGLGRVPEGWWICDIQTNGANFKRNSWDDKFINLTASATCVVKIWVF